MDFSFYYHLLLPSVGFLLATLVVDFLRWRSDLRAMHVSNMEKLTELIAALVDDIRIQMGHGITATPRAERGPAVKLHALLSLYLPSCADDSRQLLKAYGEYETATIHIGNLLRDETVPEEERKKQARAIVDEKTQLMGAIVERIGRRVEERHSSLQKWRYTP